MIKNSLKYKFVIVVCIICFCCLSIASAVSFSISYNAMLNESTQKMVEAAEKNAEKINGWLNVQGTIVKGIAEDSQVAQLTDNRETITFMKQKRLLYPYFLLVYIAYPDKKLIADDWVPPASFDCTVRDWFKSAIKGDKLYYAAPYLDANTQEMIITVSHPVKKNESLVGVVAADIEVKNLTDLVSNTKIAENSYAFLLDNKNNFIVHPNKGFQPTSTETKNINMVMDGKLSEIGRHIENQSYGFFKLLDYDGVDKYVVLSKIETNGWTFGITVPKKELEKPLNKLWLGFVISLIISLTIGVIIILLVMNSMLAPVQKLTQIVREFANNKEDARCPVSSSDEIGQLSRCFNEMADIIQEHNRTLEKKVEDRTRELRDKNEEIFESIDYAKRIQLAILPDFKDYFDSLEEHFFVIWKPRDIVGGDFYFSKKIEQNYFMIIADCTGHGVPGALMTMIVNAVLDRIITEANNNNPAEILKQLNVILKETLKQTEKYTNTNDGADIGICFICPEENKLIFAGSKIALLYCKNGEVLEIKGDKQSIGYTQSRVDYDYKNNELILEKDIVYYLTTDGFLDQNGPKSPIGFGMKSFKNVLVANCQKPLAQQKEIINQALHKFMGNERQRDDITVIGFKL